MPIRPFKPLARDSIGHSFGRSITHCKYEPNGYLTCFVDTNTKYFSEKFAISSYFSASCDPLDGGSMCTEVSLSCNMFLGLPNISSSSTTSNLVASNACKIVAQGKSCSINTRQCETTDIFPFEHRITTNSNHSCTNSMRADSGRFRAEVVGAIQQIFSQRDHCVMLLQKDPVNGY